LKWVYKLSSVNRDTLIFSTDFEDVDERTENEIREMIADIRLGLFSESISNYLRRKVIQILADGEKYSFTKIAQMLNIKDNPKLSFHLKKLKDDGVIEQDEDKRYFLSDVGKEIAGVLEGKHKGIQNRKIDSSKYITNRHTNHDHLHFYPDYRNPLFPSSSVMTSTALSTSSSLLAPVHTILPEPKKRNTTLGSSRR